MFVSAEVWTAIASDSFHGSLCDCTMMMTAGTFAYGNNGDEALFPAVRCVVVVAHTAIDCFTSAGAGFDIGWTLTIGNQTSQSPVTSYRWGCRWDVLRVEDCCVSLDWAWVCVCTFVVGRGCVAV
jgi:hypothetical protein